MKISANLPKVSNNNLKKQNYNSSPIKLNAQMSDSISFGANNNKKDK